MNFKGTSGDDDLSGTPGNDVFNMVQGGNDTVDGGGGSDVFKFGASFNSGDFVDGGSGTDKLSLDGDYSVTLQIKSTMLQNVEQIVLGTGHDYSLAVLDGVIADGQSMTINAAALTGNNTLNLDATFLTGASANTTLIVDSGTGVTYFYAGVGNNVLHGGTGGDQVFFGADFDSHDSLDGGLGSGNNSLTLSGDYSAGLTFKAAMMQNFQFLTLEGGDSYKLTMSDGNVAAGQILFVNAGGLSATQTLIFNGAHESDGSFSVTGGAGNDVFAGGAQEDHFLGMNGGNDNISGNGGDDTMSMGGALTGLDRIDGGAGSDEVDLDGDYSGGLTFKAATLTNVETLFLAMNHSYKLTLNDGNVAAGQHMDIDGDLVDAAHTVFVDAGQETNGTLYIGGGDGDDVLVGGQAGNVMSGGLGKDHLTAGTGADVFVYFSAAQSTGAGRDTVSGFDALHDDFNVPGTVGAIDAALNTGMLREGAHFDGDLAASVNAAHLAAGSAMLFTPDSGTLHGDVFLIVDVNGVAGYQAGQDLVIQLDSATHLASLGTGNFS